MSVLSAVRTCLSSGGQLRLTEDAVHLSPDLALPRKTMTAWRYRKGGYLDLESIAFFLDNERLVLSQYVKACSDAGVQIVPFAERKPLLKYLRGDKESSAYHQIDQEREQHQQHKRRHASRRASESASVRPYITLQHPPTRAHAPSHPASHLSIASSVRIPDWAWWWLLLSSLVLAVDAAYLLLRPHSLPHGSLHRYFALYDTYLHHYNPAYHNTADLFTRTLAIVDTALLLLNAYTLALAAALPASSAWAALWAVVVSAGTAAVTAFCLLHEAVAGGGVGPGGVGHRYRLSDMSTWDAGYAVGYVGTTALWIIVPLAVIVHVGGQLVRTAAAAGRVRKDKTV